MAEVLKVEDLRTLIGPVRAVDGVDFSLERGKTFALVGESGCGKSMTALTLMRLLPPGGRVVSGKVWLDGQNLLELPERAMRPIRGGKMAMIFQEPQTSLNPVLTVGKQIGEALALHKGLSGKAAAKAARELLEAVGIPEPAQRLKAYPHQLSGGMKQRVMIAMALAGDPEVLIADEPTTALDVTIQAQILELLQRLKEERGLAVFLITHDLGIVAETAQRIAVMYAGHLVEEAESRAFFRAPKHPYAVQLLEAVPTREKRGRPLAVIPGNVPSLDRPFPGCRFADRCAYAWETCHRVPPPWYEAEKGHRVRCHLYGKERRVALKEVPRGGVSPLLRAGGKPLLEVRDLKVYFPVQRGILRRPSAYVKAVDGISLDIPTGHTLALVGESGCGKTTAGKGILQLIRPTGGSVRFDGTDLSRLKGEVLRRKRREFQLIFQDPFASMNPRMMIQDIVEEGMVVQGMGDKAWREKRVEELLGQVGLDPALKRRYPHEFSGGQRQRICIARALAVEPRLIVCDEPTSALDVSVQAQILNLLRDLQGRLGIAYLFITHNIAVVEYLAQEVAVMYLGRVVEQGLSEEVLDGPAHPYTQALLSAVPSIEEEGRRRIMRLQGDLPSPVSPPEGCRFHPRCPHAMPVCRERYPDYVKLSPTHKVACFLYQASPGLGKGIE